jgi:glycine/D-amino acid oxidase-like deaminating enzyme
MSKGLDVGKRTEASTHWLAQLGGGFPAWPRSVPAETEVVVVGGGVIGVATAYWLARRGVEVLLLESRELGWGATGRNAGIFLASSSPFEEPGLLKAVLAEESIEAGYAEPGHLSLASTEDVAERMREEAARRPPGAAPLRVLARDECEDLLGLRLRGSFRGGRWAPSGATIDPARLVYGLAAAAARRGARLVTGTPAQRVEARDGGGRLAVTTALGRVRCRQVVLACNTGAAALVPALRGVLAAARGQVLATGPMPPVFRCGMAVDWGSVYWRQAPDGAIVLGGLRGADPGAEDSGREQLNPRIQSALAGFLPASFPGLPEPVVARRWAGIMDVTPDGRPMVGRVPGAPGLWLALGFGGHGLPPALGVTRALAGMVIGGDGSPALDHLDPRRFPSVQAREEGAK